MRTVANTSSTLGSEPKTLFQTERVRIYQGHHFEQASPRPTLSCLGRVRGSLGGRGSICSVKKESETGCAREAY